MRIFDCEEEKMTETPAVLKEPLGYSEAWNQVFMTDRRMRLKSFIDLQCAIEMDDRTFWKLLAEVWIDAEGPGNNLAIWRTMWSSPRGLREWAMTAEEQAEFNRLPEVLEIYRGYAGKNGKGLSWTIDRDKAVWFAKRFADRGEPMLIEGMCSKADVAAYFHRRNEAEVVIDPAKVKKQIREAV